MIDLYNKTSKHSGYQILTEEIYDFLDVENMNVLSRYEQERFDYIVKNLSLKDKSVLDIGGNTGFFTFQAIKNGAKHVDYYEGNKDHADFVELAKELYDGTKISVFNEYFSFETEKKYDIVFFLNVIHHLGDDFFAEKSIEKSKERMCKCINNISEFASVLVFQMGFNWKGNINYPLFSNGTKNEMIDFILDTTKGKWEAIAIGIPEKINEIVYREKNNQNIKRIDSLGEFLNRPIFILKSRCLS